MSRTKLGLGTVALTLLLAALPARAAVLVCGVVRSGGAAVKGANLIALERGITAVTDSSGSFCLDLDQSGVVTVRVIAIGFEPGERVVQAGDNGATVRFELVPLRGGSPGLSVSGGATPVAPTHDALAPLAPSSAAAADAHAKKGEAFLSAFPVYLSAADTTWLTSKHKGSQWDTLFVLHDELRGRGHMGAATDPETWRKLENRLDDLKIFWCVTDHPRKHSLGRAPCAYLERAIALAEARVAALTGKGLSRNAKLYLQGLASSNDRAAADWAKRVLDGVASGSAVGLGER
jgi:Carboxypeptidase regulatory-like domain